MKPKVTILVLCCGAVLLPSALNAQLPYSDPGMTDAANWTVNASALNSSPFDDVANFGVNYTSVLGVPQYPTAAQRRLCNLKSTRHPGIKLVSAPRPQACHCRAIL